MKSVKVLELLLEMLRDARRQYHGRDRSCGFSYVYACFICAAAAAAAATLTQYACKACQHIHNLSPLNCNNLLNTQPHQAGHSVQTPKKTLSEPERDSTHKF